MRSMLLLLPLILLTFSSASSAAPSGFKDHKFNGRNPSHAGGISTFHVESGDCSSVKYGDGRGESDCFNGNLRSRMAYSRYAKLGDSVQYEFEIFIPGDLRYSGGPNRRSLLEIAEWQRINTIKNHIHQMHLDSRRGLTFDDAVCVRPAEFGNWHKVSVQVRWSMNDDGIMRVTCNERVIVSRTGRTAIPPDCGQRGVFQCVPELQRPNEPIQFQLGILFRGYGERGRRDGLNPAGRVPPEGGFTIQTRNVAVKRIRFR